MLGIRPTLKVLCVLLCLVFYRSVEDTLEVKCDRLYNLFGFLQKMPRRTDASFSKLYLRSCRPIRVSLTCRFIILSERGYLKDNFICSHVCNASIKGLMKEPKIETLQVLHFLIFVKIVHVLKNIVQYYR